MAATRSSARDQDSGPAPETPEKPNSGEKRKAEDSSPTTKPGKKQQKTLEQTAPDDSEMKEAANKIEDQGDHTEANTGHQNTDTEKQGQHEDGAEEKESRAQDDPPTGAKENTKMQQNGNSGVEQSAERAEKVPSNILEKGIFYFFSRGRVGIDDPQSVQDFARSYIVLRPLPKDAKVAEGPLEDLQNNRLLALPKKVMPISHRDVFMSFVESAQTTIEDLKENFLGGSEYSTKTTGVRHTPPVTPLIEGVYAITQTNRTSHFAYVVTIPEELGEVQKDMGFRSKGSFVMSTKNPDQQAPSNASLPQGPDYPEEMLKEFNGLRWMATEPRFIDYANAQFLLIGEGRDELGKATEPTARDQKHEKETPEEEVLKLEDEDSHRTGQLHGEDTVFDDLGVSAKDFPKEFLHAVPSLKVTSFKMLLPRPQTAFCLLALTTSAYGQSQISSLSFGQTTPISPNGQQIPGFHHAFEGPAPQILSDRIVLTPPAPGHVRTGIWSESSLASDAFQLDVDFRASGPERGSGNLQIWFTKETYPASGLRSVYTVERFEGLVLTIDQYGGSGGSVRGFLNDGTVDFKSHHNLDSLAFGHCSHSFRNLGKMTGLHVKANEQGLEVVVDSKPCFKTGLIKFPSNYYFGISAASAETPDSFEISKFLVSSANNDGNSAAPQHQQAYQQQAPPPPQTRGDYSPPSNAEYSAQHHELLNRLHILSQNIENVNRELGALSSLQSQRHEEIKQTINNPNNAIDTINRRMEMLATDLTHIKKDIGMAGFGTGEYKASMSKLQVALREGQTELLGSLPGSLGEIVSTQAPKMWTFLFCLMAFQLILLGLYMVYQQRWKNSPKKLL
ncbi:MAG: hypothetical protein Q9162_007610 [Coniocarpon cinnabarinum]